MMKSTDFVFIVLVLITASATYAIKYNSANQRAKLDQLHEQISIQNEAIDILNADWSLLTSPARLQNLVEQYHEELPLDQIQPHQVISVDALPLRPVLNPEQRLAQERQENLQKKGISGLITGSIENTDTKTGPGR